MCGRYTLTTPTALLAEYFGIAPLPGLRARYNIAPTQPVAVLRGDPQRHWAEVRWGLIPPWAKDPAIGNRMINARGETVADKPAFRTPFAQRRCLIAADGFYEWQRLDNGRKQPFYLRRYDGSPFAFAGLWERWHDRPGNTTIESCALITTTPNELVRPIHDRMPAIVPSNRFDVWLDPDASREQLQRLLVPYTETAMQARPVSAWVNKPAHDDPRCIDALTAPSPPARLFD